MTPAAIAFLCITGVFTTFEVLGMNWTKLTLIIDEIEFERSGEIGIFIFLEDGFPKKHEKAIKRYCFDVTQKSNQLVIEVPDIAFAIKAHHDEDRSGTVTKNWTGIIPAEGLGFSSGARMGFGPPTFNEAMVNIPASNKIRLRMVYP